MVRYGQSYPYSLLTDGSNDVGFDKMNPVTVRIFDIGLGKVESRFRDMCATKGLTLQQLLQSSTKSTKS